MGQVSYDFNENLKQKMKILVCSDRSLIFPLGFRRIFEWASGVNRNCICFALKRSLIALRNCPCPLGFGSSTLNLNTLYHPVRGVKNGCETR